jgi:hypothetical protein
MVRVNNSTGKATQTTAVTAAIVAWLANAATVPAACSTLDAYVPDDPRAVPFAVLAELVGSSVRQRRPAIDVNEEKYRPLTSH